MENEEKIKQGEDLQQEERSLSTTYAILLCIFFCYLFRISIGGLSQLSKFIIPDILQSESPLFYAMFYLDWVLWIVFGYWAIILALKGSKSAIPCLKLCLPFLFVALLINGMTRISSLHFGSLWLPLLIIFFPLIFFIYLCTSRTIREDYPKETRRLGIAGAIGVLLYVFLGVLLSWMLVSSIQKSINGKKVEPSRVALFENEMTDGRVIFKPKETWQLDSIVTPLTIEDVYCFHDTLDLSIVRVSCTTEEYEPSRHFYIYSITENQPFDTRNYLDEVGHRQLETDEAVYFIDQYEYLVDSTRYYWTYASRLGRTVEKGVRLSVVDRDSLKMTIDEAIDFLNNTTFDLGNRLFKKD